MRDPVCPVCGYSGTVYTYVEKPFSALYGPPIMATVRVDTCVTCNESGDFTGENDRPIECALALSGLKSVPIMAEKLASQHNCSRPYIERVMGLSIGSIAKCEAGEFDEAVIIALRTACTFPLILLMLDHARTASAESEKTV